MIVGARQGGFKNLTNCDIYAQQSLEFAENGVKKQKKIQWAAVLQAQMR